MYYNILCNFCLSKILIEFFFSDEKNGLSRTSYISCHINILM